MSDQTQAEPTWPNEESRHPHRSSGFGWALFAATIFVVSALFNLVWGIAALSNDDHFRVDELLFGDLSLWGAINLGFAAAQLVTALLIVLRRSVGSILGIIIAGLHATVTLFSIGAYPLWSVMLLVLDALVIYALTVHAFDD
jgi:hypothetical protein